MKYKKGDWVRFYRNGELAIGVVEYTEPYRRNQEKQVIMTNVGKAMCSEVLEARTDLARLDHD